MDAYELREDRLQNNGLDEPCRRRDVERGDRRLGSEIKEGSQGDHLLESRRLRKGPGHEGVAWQLREDRGVLREGPFGFVAGGARSAAKNLQRRGLRVPDEQQA